MSDIDRARHILDTVLDGCGALACAHEAISVIALVGSAAPQPEDIQAIRGVAARAAEDLADAKLQLVAAWDALV